MTHGPLPAGCVEVLPSLEGEGLSPTLGYVDFCPTETGESSGGLELGHPQAESAQAWATAGSGRKLVLECLQASILGFLPGFSTHTITANILLSNEHLRILTGGG